ncbi:MAG: hypothetical protein M3O61_13335, partial [Gemmatimonadota bacterium]|nr:hypothetical protein [Gemmatimonadota bacterium]
WREEDSRQKTQTKLHTLKAYFNFSALVSLFSIVLLLLISLFGFTNDAKQVMITRCVLIHGFEICWDRILTSTSLGLAAINILFMWIFFRIFFSGFIEEGGARD